MPGARLPHPRDEEGGLALILTEEPVSRPQDLMSRKMASELKVLSHHGLIEGVIKCFCLTRSHVFHMHSYGHYHEFVSDLSVVGDSTEEVRIVSSPRLSDLSFR
jgi:hypothetical protein